MESDFLHDHENFEQFLRDSTQDFKMYPSRKVWYSLYNNLHPGSKWPSLAVCLILISTILFIDISNNNKINKINQSFSVSSTAADPAGNEHQKMGSPGVRYFANKPAEFLLFPSENVDTETPSISNILQKNNQSEHTTHSTELLALSSDPVKTASRNAPETPAHLAQTPEVAPAYPDLVSAQVHPETQTAMHILPPAEISAAVDARQQDLTQTPKTEISEPGMAILENNIAANLVAETTLEKQLAENEMDEAMWRQSWVDDYAFYNKPKTSIWKKRASMQFYVTPSLGYRAMYKNNDYEGGTNSLIALNLDEPEDNINQNAAYNMEFGLAIRYALNKKWNAKAGMQFNHTNYTVNAGQLFHPAQTTLIVTDQNTGLPVVEAHTSYYSNRPTENNETRLKNSTIQFSLPVGLDYALTQQKNFEWRVGLTIQPTYIANGEAYLISSDRKNYVSMPSMIKRWNANAAFETFISYKTNAGFNIDFGPQFRYQLKSTYKKQYGYSEKLYNIGLKLGITRGF